MLAAGDVRQVASSPVARIAFMLRRTARLAERADFIVQGLPWPVKTCAPRDDDVDFLARRRRTPVPLRAAARTG